MGLPLRHSEGRWVRINVGGRGAKDIHCSYRVCFPIVCPLQPADGGPGVFNGVFPIIEDFGEGLGLGVRIRLRAQLTLAMWIGD